jgi:hypothetical protein
VLNLRNLRKTGGFLTNRDVDGYPTVIHQLTYDPLRVARRGDSTNGSPASLVVARTRVAHATCLRRALVGSPHWCRE